MAAATGTAPPASSKEQILALETKLTNTNKQLADMKKRLKGNNDQQGDDNGNRNRNRCRNNNSNRRCSNKPFPAELKNKPAPAAAEMNNGVTLNGKTYYYCFYHKKWGEHKLGDRKAHKKANSSNTTPATGNTGTTQAGGQQRGVRAVQAVVTGACE